MATKPTKAPAKAVAKAPVKKVVKTTTATKTVAKAPAKAVAKAPAKAVAKAPVKAVAKAPVKAVAKPVAKKPLATYEVKRIVEVKEPVKVRGKVVIDPKTKQPKFEKKKIVELVNLKTKKMTPTPYQKAAELIYKGKATNASASVQSRDKATGKIKWQIKAKKSVR